MQQRRLNQRRDNEHVHGRVTRETGVADFLRDAQPTVNFHGSGIAALHLGQELRGVFLLKQDAVHPAATKIDSERKPYWTSANNNDLSIHRAD